MSGDAPASPHADLFAQARFEAAVGTDFEVLAGDGAAVAAVLRLVEVSARASPRSHEQYSALFRGPAAPFLPQATYSMRHPAFDKLPLFIVPVGKDDAGVTYEACVVRRVPDAPGAAST